jgi:hypothetical protein
MHEALRVETEQAVARGDHRGILGGQILSLHPIGRWLLGRQTYRHAIGAWIDCSEYGQLSPEQTVADPRYQDALLALLMSAHEYRQAYEKSESDRHAQQSIGCYLLRERDDSANHIEPVRNDSSLPEMELFDELAHHQHIRCNRCGESVEYVRWAPADRKHFAIISYRCRYCGEEIDRRVTLEEFKRALADED